MPSDLKGPQSEWSEEEVEVLGPMHAAEIPILYINSHSITFHNLLAHTAKIPILINQLGTFHINLSSTTYLIDSPYLFDSPQLIYYNKG